MPPVVMPDAPCRAATKKTAGLSPAVFYSLLIVVANYSATVVSTAAVSAAALSEASVSTTAVSVAVVSAASYEH